MLVKARKQLNNQLLIILKKVIMNEEPKTIGDLKKALLVLISISMNTEKALEDDNHIDFGEGTKIAFSALGLIKVIKEIKPLAIKFKSLTSLEKSELTAWFRKSFDFINDNLEAIIEDIFETLLDMAGLLTVVSQLENK